MCTATQNMFPKIIASEIDVPKTMLFFFGAVELDRWIAAARPPTYLIE
jgi:hypothetical protein